MYRTRVACRICIPIVFNAPFCSLSQHLGILIQLSQQGEGGNRNPYEPNGKYSSLHEIYHILSGRELSEMI